MGGNIHTLLKKNEAMIWLLTKKWCLCIHRRDNICVVMKERKIQSWLLYDSDLSQILGKISCRLKKWKEVSWWTEINFICYFYWFRMRIAIWWSSCFYHVFYMIIEFFRLNCTLLESGIPIRILVHLMRLYIISWQDWFDLIKGFARFLDLAKGSCQMFGGILPPMARIWFVGVHTVYGHSICWKSQRASLAPVTCPTTGATRCQCAQKNKTSWGKSKFW